MNTMSTPNKVVFDTEKLLLTHRELKNETSREMVKALGHNPETSDTSAHITKTTDYKNASRSAGQVSYSRADQVNAHYELSQKDARHGGTLHTHIESQGHAWQWSAQDMTTIKSNAEDPLNAYHVLTYVCADGSTMYRAVDRNGKEIPFITSGMKTSYDLMGVLVTASGKVKQISTDIH